MTASGLSARLEAGRRRLSVARLAGWMRDLRLLDAVIVTAFPLAAVLVLVAGSVGIHRLSKEYATDWFGDRYTVPGAFYMRFEALQQLPSLLAARRAFADDSTDTGIIHLEVPQSAFDTVRALDQEEWAPWVDGTLRYGGTTLDVRVRKRGDFSMHWLSDKRSMTVRTPREEFYKSYRSFGLSAKDVLPAFVANRLAHWFDLVTPRTEVVPVFLNGSFYGLFRLVEPADESFLRPLGRMPGNIFRGDRAARGEYYKGQPRGLFENPGIWERAAANDRPTATGPDHIAVLARAAVGTTFADHQRVMAEFDRAEVSRLFAYMLVTGDPYHVDGIHNELLYEDPTDQVLHQVPWDIQLQELDREPGTMPRHFQAFLRDPWLVDGIGRATRAAIDGGIFRVADSMATATEARYAAFFAYDRLRGGLVPDVGTAAEIRRRLEHNEGLLRSRLTDAGVAWAVGEGGSERVLDLEARGYVGADLYAIESDRPLGAVTVFRDRDLDGARGPGDELVRVRVVGRRIELERPEPLLATWRPTPRGLLPGRMPYRYFVAGTGAGRLTPVVRNRLDGSSVTPTPWETGSAVEPATGWHPWRYPDAPPPRAQRWSGTVRLTATVRIPVGDTLILAPGTTVRLGPDVSLVSRGRVLARGTAERPVRILRDDESRPWGAFTLLGHGADSSIMEHIEFAGGGGALVDRIEYIGMVNIHSVRGVEVAHALIRDNIRSDDTFHALHASFVLRDSRILRGNSDALDLDQSTGLITRNRFEQSGGDAIDLMTSDPLITDNVIVGSGDKGISIGENSSPFVFNNHIERTVRGIEVKDHSAPVLLHNTIVDCGVGLRMRRKNWRYNGGGWPLVAATVFRGNRVTLQRDAFSRLTVVNSPGLDSVAAEAPAAGIPALAARWGIDLPEDAAPGRLMSWRPRPAARVVEHVAFEDDFGEVADGWRASGGAVRLEKRHDALRLDSERQAGVIRRAVSWDLPAGGSVLAEVGGRDLRAVNLRVMGDGREATVSPPLPDVPQAFALAVLVLPPGRYHTIELTADPRPGLSHVIQRATGLSVLRAGRAELRGYTVLASEPR